MRAGVILYRTVGGDVYDRVTFEQRLEECQEIGFADTGSKSLRAEGTASAKALNQHCEWHIPKKKSLLSLVSIIHVCNGHIMYHPAGIFHCFSPRMWPPEIRDYSVFISISPGPNTALGI